MNPFRQFALVTAMNVRNVALRPGASLVVVVGSAGTVGVLIAVLAMATGLLKAAAVSGRADRVIMVHAGAVSEGTSGLTLETAQIVAATAGIRKDATGRALISAEVLEQIPVEAPGMRGDATVILRGVGTLAFLVRPELRLVQGRTFRSGLHELIVGHITQEAQPALHVGSTVRLVGQEWTIVGVFASASKAHDAEWLADAGAVRDAFGQDQFSSITAVLESPSVLDNVRRALGANPAVSVDVQPEREYYLHQSASLATILRVVAYVVGGLMAIGATFGGLNAMYSVVRSRRRELATLRAIGFGPLPLVCAIMAEALVLALAAAALAGTVVWFLFEGGQVAQGNGAGSTVVYTVSLSPGLLTTGIIWACLIGALGALPPALHAARLPVVTALRAQH